MALSQKISERHLPELDQLANAAMASRSLRVAYFYVPFSIIVSLVTDLYKDFPLATFAFVGLFLVIGTLRTHLARGFKNTPDTALWMKKFNILTMIPALALGSVGPLVFLAKGASWDLNICVLGLTGVSAGASSSLAPRIKTFRTFELVLLMPTVITLAVFAEGKTQGLSVLMFLWVGQVLILGHYFHKEFWAAIKGQHQLKQRATALEKANTKVKQASRVKGDFLANMSHEIRTPLNGIIGMTDLVLESDLDKQQLDYLQDVKSSGETLLRIINEILDFSKIEAGGIEIESIPFSVKKVMKKVVRPLRFSAESRANELVIDLDPNLPERLKGDPHRLWQILTNLTSNAVKFTENGKITLSAEMMGQVGDRITLAIKVSDTGIGISPRAQASIFKAFSQADESTTRKFGGTGLGLAISKKLVELMDGAITLKSTVGTGSSFAILLHLEEASVEDAKAAKPQPKTDAIDLSGLRVLLAEDNTVNAKLATRLLEKSGILVEWAQDGKQAVDAWRENSFDMVLMDVQMPVMDGFEATVQIRKAEGETENPIPIIALTAHAIDGYRDQCLEKGMDDFLTKPLNPRRLRDCLGLWAPQPTQSEPQSV